MADGANVGSAYVTLFPSMDGFGDDLAKEFGPAGTKAGKQFGDSMSKGVEAGADDASSSLSKVGSEAEAQASSIGGAFKSALSGIGSLISGSSMFGGVVSQAKQAASGISSAFGGVKSGVSSAISGVQGAIKSGLAGAESAAKSAMSKAADAIPQPLKSVGSKVKGALSDVSSSAASAVSDLSSKLKAEASKAADSFTSAFDGIASKVKGAFSGIGGVIAGLGIGAAITESISAAAEAQTYMSRLSASAQANSVSTQAMNATYNDLIGVLGETDRVVETSGNLFALCGDNQAQLESLTTSLTGAYSQFGDGMPIEALAEAANETAKAGTVTGSFADALNWVSASADQWTAAMGSNTAAQAAFQSALDQGATKEDAFNQALAACTSEQERQQLVVSAMNALYGEAGQKYQQANADLIAYNQSQDAMSTSVANFGSKLMPVATLVTTFASRVLNALTNMIPPIDVTAVMTSLQQLGTFLMGVLMPAVQPIVTALQNMANTLGPVIMPLVQQVMALLQGLMTVLSPIASVVGQLVAAVIDGATQVLACVIPVITQCVEMVNQYMPQIQSIVETVMSAIQTAIDTALSAIQTVWNAVWPAIQAFVEGVMGQIQVAIESAMGVIQGIITTVTGIISGDWEQVWSGIQQIAQSVWDGITGLIDSNLSTIKDFIDSALSGIRSIWESAWNALGDFLDNAWNGFVESVSGGNEEVMALLNNLPSRILGAFSGVGSWLIDSGRSLLTGFISGIQQGFSQAVSAVQSGLNWIRGFFPFSPAKEGPFSGHGYTSYSGKALMGDFAESIRSQAGKVASATEEVIGVAKGGLTAQLTSARTITIRQAERDEYGDALDTIAGLLRAIADKDRDVYLDGSKVSAAIARRSLATATGRGVRM